MTAAQTLRSDETQKAYTGVRWSVLREVPASAMRVLDVGCSNGVQGAALRELVENRYVAGIEFDESFCAQARSRLDRVIQADLNHFDWAASFQDERFDCIVFADVLEHLMDPEQALRGAAGLLTPGGTVVVSVPNIRHFSALKSIYVDGTFPRRKRGLFDRTHLRWFTSRDAAQLLTSSGLEVVSLKAVLRVGEDLRPWLNRLLLRWLNPLSHWPVVREFCGYQLVLVGSKPNGR